MGRNPWQKVVRELGSYGVIEPAVILVALCGYHLRLAEEEAGEGGRFPRVLEAIAEVHQRSYAELQREVLSQLVKPAGAAQAVQEALGLREVLERLPSVSEAGAFSPKEPGFYVALARSIAEHDEVSLPSATVSDAWLPILREVMMRGVADPTALVLLARFTRVAAEGMPSIEPLDEDDAVATVAHLFGRDSVSVQEEVSRRIEYAMLLDPLHPFEGTRQARDVIAGLSGISSVRPAFDVPGSPIVAKRAPDGRLPAAPWEVFSEPPASMRWRMGQGEDLMTAWLPFWESLSPGEQELYLTSCPPPPEWAEWLALLRQGPDG